MKPLRSTFAALLAAGVAVGTGYFGFNFVQDTQFARAADKVEETRANLAKAEDLSSVFRYVGKVVEPSVVNIAVTKKEKGPRATMRGMPFDREQLRKFFRDRNGGEEPDLPELPAPDDQQQDDGPQFEQHGTGSGVIMEVNNGTAFILTNNHVAGDATQMEVTLADGRKFSKATLVGADKKTDLAVVKVEADRLIGAKWGNSDELQKGDWVMAFGSPFGYVGSMTHGIVSALNRRAGILGDQGYENFIQVDAPINPGNSGGPLVNVRGEVIGINTAIASRTGAFSGIGFAIPSNQAKFVYESLKKNGKVTRGWLGVSIQDVSSDLKVAQSLGYQGTNGVLVRQVVPNTPASGKLDAGDIITTLDGKNVENVQQLRNMIAATPPNTDIKLGVFHDEKEQTVTLRLGEQPENMMVAGAPGKGSPMESDADKLGLRMASPSPELMQKWGLKDVKQGAVVTAVERNSLAAKEGIQPGDVITKIGKQEVKDAAAATDLLSKVDLKKGVRLYVTSKDPQTGQVMSRFVFIQQDAK